MGGTVGPRLSTISPTFFNDYSFEFDGTDDYVVTQTSVNGTDFTLSYWVNANGSYANFQRFHPVSIRPSNNTANQSIGYLYTKGATLYPSYQAYDSTDTIYSTWSARDLDFIGAGWHNIIWTFNVTTREIYLYVDGVAQTFTSFDGLNTTSYLIGSRITNIITYSNINIGATWVPTEYWGGGVDEVSTYDRILTQEEITSISTTPTDLTDLSPLSWYRMGDNGSYKSPQWLLPNNENKDKVSNYSFQLDGINDYIDCGDSNDFSFGDGITDSPFSISAWINIKSFGTNNVVFSKDSGLPNREYAIGFFNTFKNLRFFIKTQGGNSQQSIDSTTLFSTDTWYNLTCTYNGVGGNNAADGMKIYINGVLETPTNIIKQTYVAMSNTTAPVNIGRYGAAASPLSAKVDEVSIYGSELSQSEITDLFHNGEPTTVTGAISHWRMGEEATFSTNWTVPDQVGSNDGTSNGMNIFDRVGSAPSSENNAVSFNMDLIDRVEDTP